MKLLIKNAKLILDGKDVVRNIICEDGIIKKISTTTVPAEKVINADFNYVIPGLIDGHVHFRDPGATDKEDFFTGSKAAVSGGVTTVLDMPNTKPATSTLKALAEKKKIAAKKSVVNFGFHFGAEKNNLDQIRNARNIASVKVYMGSSTGDLLVTDSTALRHIFKVARLVTIHAEDEALIIELTKKYKRNKHPKVHADIRNNTVAVKATTKAIKLAKETGARIMICHTSTKEELSLIDIAKSEGIKVYCEIAPHHLFMTKEEVEDNYKKMNPPLRSEADKQELWFGIKSGVVDTIATDHAPHLKKDKDKGYWEAPSGVPGVEMMLPLLLNAVNEGKLNLGDVVRLTSRNPAKIFGIKNKGMVKEGYDADLVIVDMTLEKEVKDKDMKTKCKWSPYSGMKLRGWPIFTVVNGQIVYDHGKINDIKGKEVIIR